MTELTRRCLELSLKERTRLINVLQESLNEREDDGSRFSELYKAATKVCGQGILTSSRDFKLVMGRRMIAYQMRKEGYSLMSIGKHLIRHHASVIHMIRQMEDVMEYPKARDLEMGYWHLFEQELHDIDSRADKGTLAV
jgi:chromosomal replication initiation ATPase DnaA